MKNTLSQLAAFGIAAVSAHAQFNINITFTPQALADLNATEQSFFTDAAGFWGGIITGYRDGGNRTWDLSVDTFSQPQSGGSITLGSAGPSNLFFSGFVSGTQQNPGGNYQFILPGGGNASFNVHPDAGALNPLVIRHELGHALGIGTLWEDNEIYNDGILSNSNRTLTGGTPGEYVGFAALSAFQSEFDPSATFVPIELDGGPGTANGHWNEVADNINAENSPGFDSDPGDGSAAPTVIAGPNLGESLDDELMTGFLSGSAYLSNTTIASLSDIGYTVVPEPGYAALVFAGSMLALLRYRRKWQ